VIHVSALSVFGGGGAGFAAGRGARTPCAAPRWTRGGRSRNAVP